MTTAPIRVMVADDSAVVRGIWARALEADPGVRVVASAYSGRSALDVLQRRDVDVVVLDVEMPEMSGLEALPLMLQARPGLRVVMASSLTLRGAEVTMTALALGAADYVAKPSAAQPGAMDAVGQELLRKVRALAGRGETDPRAPSPARPVRRPSPRGTPPRAIVVASSTGGPNALTTLVSGLPRAFPLPILIVQHMPPLFTAMLADRLQRASSRRCVEASDGLEVTAGTTYVAPGDHHMTVEARGGTALLRLDKDPPLNFCRPAADPLFRSAATAFGPALTAVVLTGMGHDGLEGARAVSAGGGTVIAQDQPTSVVWGMPGAVVGQGLAHHVLPLPEIAAVLDEQARIRR